MIYKNHTKMLSRGEPTFSEIFPLILHLVLRDEEYMDSRD